MKQFLDFSRTGIFVAYYIPDELTQKIYFAAAGLLRGVWHYWHAPAIAIAESISLARHLTQPDNNVEKTQMLYAIMSEDIEHSVEKRLSARPEHLARLQILQNEGRLIIAGPHPAIDSEDPGPAGFTGSLVIAEFPTYEDAKAWADSDPFVTAGVYRSVNIKPFKKVLP